MTRKIHTAVLFMGESKFSKNHGDNRSDNHEKWCSAVVVIARGNHWSISDLPRKSRMIFK